MPQNNKGYEILRYQRNLRGLPDKDLIAYSADNEKRKAQYAKNPPNGPLLESGIAKIYQPTAG